MYVLLLKAQYIMSTILTITAPSPLQSLCVHYVEHNFTQNCLISHQFFNNMLVGIVVRWFVCLFVSDLSLLTWMPQHCVYSMDSLHTTSY